MNDPKRGSSFSWLLKIMRQNFCQTVIRSIPKEVTPQPNISHQSSSTSNFYPNSNWYNSDTGFINETSHSMVNSTFKFHFCKWWQKCHCNTSPSEGSQSNSVKVSLLVQVIPSRIDKLLIKSSKPFTIRYTCGSIDKRFVDCS